MSDILTFFWAAFDRSDEIILISGTYLIMLYFLSKYCNVYASWAPKIPMLIWSSDRIILRVNRSVILISFKSAFTGNSVRPNFRPRFQEISVPITSLTDFKMRLNFRKEKHGISASCAVNFNPICCNFQPKNTHVYECQVAMARK